MVHYADFLKLLGLFSSAAMIILGAVLFLLRHLATKWMDKQFQVRMREVEHQYKILEHRSEVVFSSLHLQRAKAIRLVYDSLLQLKNAVLDCINRAHVDDGKGNERFLAMWNAGTDLHHVLEKQRIYLDEATCNLVDVAAQSYDQAGLSLTFGAGVPVPLTEYYPKLERSRHIIKNDCQVAMKALQDQFRKILGVEELKV